jgi:pimeloyl-ACP methyl ester carboxylesterase
MGTKDLPKVIDYILQTTGADQIFYVGHSQGTTISYVLCSERPEYNSKIRAIFSLAPVAFMSNVNSPMLQMTASIGDQMAVSCQLI